MLVILFYAVDNVKMLTRTNDVNCTRIRNPSAFISFTSHWITPPVVASTPWFEEYRECFLSIIAPSDHEYIRSYAACVFVVSSSHADPMNQFAQMTISQHQQQVGSFSFTLSQLIMLTWCKSSTTFALVYAFDVVFFYIIHYISLLVFKYYLCLDLY